MSTEKASPFFLPSSGQGSRRVLGEQAIPSGRVTAATRATTLLEPPREACTSCPFRRGAKMGYDEDAMLALEDGCEPSCHDDVGLRRIFHHGAASPSPCRGYEAFIRGDPGFRKPRLVRQS